RRLALETRRSGRSFRAVVNEHLRRSLAASRPARRPVLRIAAREMRLQPGIDLSNIEQLLDALDGPGRR
ncbi:MAG: hypothetical protein ACRD96_22765, partial [Bryobacteraceae bacterium]